MNWSFTFPESLWYCWHLLGAEVFVRRTGNCWESFCRKIPWEKRGGACGGPEQKDPESALTGKVVFDKTIPAGDTAHLKPCFPEQPFVLDLSGTHLYPGAEIALKLRLPPMFRLMSAESAENETHRQAPEILFTFAPFILKQTWYGPDSMRGVVGFPLSAAGEDNDCSAFPEISCTVLIRNRNRTALDPEKVPLNTGLLAIYEHNGKLICDDPVIDICGKDFNPSERPANGSLLTPAGKSETGETLIHRGTQIIKNLTRF